MSNAWPTAARTGLAVPGDRRVDELRVLLCEHLVADAELVHGAWAEVLDQNVCGTDEVLEHLLALGCGQIEPDTELAAVVLGVVGAELLVPICEIGRKVARDVGVARVLDLDDGRAEVSKHLGGVGTCQHARQVEHDDAVQGAGSRQLSHDSSSDAAAAMAVATVEGARMPRMRESQVAVAAMPPTSIPVSMPMPSSIHTRASVARLPVAPLA